MWSLLSLNLALAGGLTLVVEPDPAPVAAERFAAPVRLRVPVGVGEIVADGRLTEAAWSATLAAPPLGPWMIGASPPASTLKVVAGEQGLGLGWSGLPRGQRVELLIDPDGLQQRWWRLELTEVVRLEVCDTGALPVPAVPTPIQTHAVPCVLVEGTFGVRSGDRAEVLLPWEQLGDTTSSLRLLWRQGNGEHGGTWSPSGRSEPRPEHGLSLDLPVPTGRVRLEEVFDGGMVRRVLIQVDGGVEPQRWRWRRMWQGQQVASGEVRVAYRASHLELEGPVYPDEGFEIGPAVAGPLRPVLVGRLRPQEPALWSVSPWVVDRAALRWRSAVPLTGVEVQVLDRQGALVGEGIVDLSAGTGTVWLRWPVDAADEVRVLVPALGVDLPLLREPR
jgi:hypothetical protein